MSIPADLKYTDSHEWIRVESDGSATVGITHHAQDLLGDLVFVENPKVGRMMKKGEECGVVESVKAASDIYAPLSGEVTAVNEALDESPQLINESAYKAWMFKLKPSVASEVGTLLDADAYQKLVEAGAH